MSVCIVTVGIYLYVRDHANIYNEGFNADVSAQIRITSCPNGSTSFITSAGDTNCCDSDIQNGKCSGKTLCSLSPTRFGGSVQTCSDIMTYLWAQRTNDWCPRNMYFYGTMGTSRPSGTGVDPNIWGCSTSQPKQDGSKPVTGTGIDFCTIYGSDTDNLATVTIPSVPATATVPEKPAVVVSCRNKRDLEEISTPTPTATRTLVNTSSSSKKTPALFNISFTPIKNVGANPLPVICTDWPRFRMTLELSAPSVIPLYEKVQGVHVYFCEAAKAYYIDGTLSGSNALGVPSGNSLPGLCPT